MDATVTEIHRYPTRPEGYEEPLFPTPESRREVAAHLLRSSWLGRASELRGRAGEAAHVLEEPVELTRDFRGRAELVRPRGWRCSRRRRVVEVLDRWREVRGWWNEGLRVTRTVFRVLLSDGAVVDLARERSGWSLVGLVD